MAVPRPITVELPAEPENVQILRIMTMAAVGSGGAPVEQVSDAALAVDEAAGLLLTLPDATRLTAHISPGTDSLAVTIAADAAVEDWPPSEYSGTLAEAVLTSLTSGVEFAREAGSPQVRLEI